MANPLSRRLARIEAQQALQQTPWPSFYFYNILDKNGMSHDNYWRAGQKYGDLRPATPDEILDVKKHLQARSLSQHEP